MLNNKLLTALSGGGGASKCGWNVQVGHVGSVTLYLGYSRYAGDEFGQIEYIGDAPELVALYSLTGRGRSQNVVLPELTGSVKVGDKEWILAKQDTHATYMLFTVDDVGQTLFVEYDPNNNSGHWGSGEIG